MVTRWAADGVLILHFAFIVFACLGGWLAWFWPRLIWAQLPAAGWAIWIELSGRICPLTYLENDLRLQAGQAGYSSSFIEHHLLGVIYPQGLTREIQMMLAAAVLVLNMLAWALLLWRWLRRNRRCSQ